MKKVFLVLLCASLFVACGNKKQKADELVADTVAVQEVAEEVVEEVAEVVEEPAPAPAPAKKATKPATKKTNTTVKEKTTVESEPASTSLKEHAKKSAENVGHTVINKVEKDATKAVNENSTPNKARR